jgi:glucose/arabinose dehydrogenase
MKRQLRFAVAVMAALMMLAPAGVARAASPPATPVFTEPATDGQIVNPSDVHMETTAFSDPDPGDTFVCADWEILLGSTSAVVWQSPCNRTNPLHVHLGDGTFVNGNANLAYDTDYLLRARHKSSTSDTATQWGAWGQRRVRTSSPPPSGTPTTWTVQQSGYQVEYAAGGLTLPVNIAFIPNPGPRATDPYFYVSELYGNIKVVSRDGTSSDFIRGVLNYRPSGIFPGSGEQGLTGIVVDPASGDVFASMLYESDPGGPKYPKVVRFKSSHNGTVAGSSTTILDVAGESMRESHQISNLSIGPDGKLYVHMGDGFDSSTALNLGSFRGKILRLNLDGTPAMDNPFYSSGDGINARDYVFAYGFRNPFGGAWRAADGFHYEVENGPSVDRFAKVIRGTSYGWNNTDASMAINALYTWSPPVAPVNLVFVQSSTFGGSGFPSDKQGHAFVSESGPTYAPGPQTNGKRITEFVLDASGNRQSGPIQLVRYTGSGRATAAGLAAGPDGLYFTDLYKDSGTAATDSGANVLRIKHVGTTGGNTPPSVSLTSPTNGTTFAAGAPVTLTAQASDADGTVSKVEFFRGSAPLGQATAAPYSIAWTACGGKHTLTARATDSGGATTTSAPISIKVNGKPC